MSTRQLVTLREAAAAFGRRPTPWILAGGAVTALSVRGLLGSWGRGDVVVLAVVVVGFPLLEWVVHVVLLHWRPRTVGGRVLDPLVARKHREHHRDPRDAELVFIPMPTLVKALAATVAVGVVGFPMFGVGVAPGLTFIAVQSVLGTAYEWTHYLVHSDYRPKSGLYRAIWRNHRLHHYKNEQYWFTVTTQGTVDRLLGTYPDAAAVPTSPTARSLHADASAAATERTR